jgi:two-component system, OmpR family, sensor histidine kinase AdeS
MNSLSSRIAVSAIIVSVVAAMVAAFVPGYVYQLRDQLFLSSLPESDQQTLEQLLSAHGQCSPLVHAFKTAHGFEPWQINYEWALGALIFLTAACCGAIAIASARRIARPIASLADNARSIALGARDLPHPLLGGMPHEIVTLHRDFSTMVTALDAADQDIRLRSAAIAHELRTPLAVMRGRLVGVQEGVFSVDQTVFDSLMRQITLIDQLVTDLNLLASGKDSELNLQSGPVQLDSIANAVIEALLPKAKETGTALLAQLEPVTVMADAARIERALLND